MLDLTAVAHISPEIHSGMRRSTVRPRDVLLNITGASIGRSCVVPAEVREANVNQHVCIIRCNGEVVPSFVQAMLELPHTQQQIRDTAAGGSREGLNFQQVAALSIPWVEPSVQRILERLRAKSNVVGVGVSKLLAAKRELKRGLLRELLTGQRRFPEFIGRHAKSSVYGNNASHPWRTVALSEIAEPVTRRNHVGEMRVLTCSGEHGLIDQTEYFTKSVAGASTEDYYLLNRGEFAYNRSAMNGYPFGATKRLERYERGVVSTLNICFALTGDWEGDFAAQYFESGLLNEQLRRVTRVGARAHGLLNITKADFFALKVPVPAPEEQCRIASVLALLAREITLLEAQRDQMELQRHALIQTVLSGGIEVDAPTQES
jgi:type I restriction enzyme S subunit